LLNNPIDIFPVSLVVPVYNESQTITELIATIKKQSVRPAETILVDGGSSDNTIQLMKDIVSSDNHFRIIEAGTAMPGQGRNIGAKAAFSEWIAFTDAGIKLDTNWMESLIRTSKENPDASVIYGNFSPQITGLFDKSAAIAYVPEMRPGEIRTKSIASCMMKKELWQKSGGFPEWRAAEDLVFIENLEKSGAVVAFAQKAMVYWQLRKDLRSTYRKFELYSMYNVWAKRQAYWHYGIARQWTVAFLSIIASIIFKWYWILFIPAWMLARAAKRIFMHRREFGIATLLNPAVVFMVILITFTIDVATFSGWISAILHKQPSMRVTEVSKSA
jgi:glycosyltransferase involved in cell wall biosynthesis